MPMYLLDILLALKGDHGNNIRATKSYNLKVHFTHMNCKENFPFFSLPDVALHSQNSEDVCIHAIFILWYTHILVS